jgi:hypothetical protein
MADDQIELVDVLEVFGRDQYGNLKQLVLVFRSVNPVDSRSIQLNF